MERLAERDPEREDQQDEGGAKAPARDLLTATALPARVPLER